MYFPREKWNIRGNVCCSHECGGYGNRRYYYHYRIRSGSNTVKIQTIPDVNQILDWYKSGETVDKVIDYIHRQYNEHDAMIGAILTLMQWLWLWPVVWGYGFRQVDLPFCTGCI